jgi:hypothetical protein
VKVYFAALVIFLLAFAGLAAGLILKRKGLRGGCRPTPGAESDCQCKSATKSNVKEQVNQHNKRDL